MPANELNFDTIVPATKVGKLYNYIQIPAFSYTGIIWKDVSEAIVQFNYSLSNNFILREFPVKPVGVNFIICIRYRIGETVYRYKLWDNLNEVMPNIDKYSGQVIKKNCVVEIWTLTNQETISLASPLNLETSIRSLPASLTNLSEVENAESSLVANLGLQTLAPALPTTGLYAWYKYGLEGIDIVTSGLDVTSWLDQSGNNRHLVATLPNRPTWGFYDGLFTPKLAAVQRLVKTGLNFEPMAMYLVTKQDYVATAGILINFGTPTGYFNIKNITTELNVINASGVPTQLEHYTELKVIHQRMTELGLTETHRAGIDKFYATDLDQAVGIGYETATEISLGDSAAVSSETQEVFELIIYTSVISDEQHIQILQYLANKYSSEPVFILPNSWDTTGNIAWLDN